MKEQIVSTKLTLKSYKRLQEVVNKLTACESHSDQIGFETTLSKAQGRHEMPCYKWVKNILG